MIKIDGSYGEGGGQILRSSLGLSMVTGEPFKIERIRSGRKKPGLLRQHLTAVKAAAQISEAEIEGAELGSQTLTFIPGQVKGGEYHFSVGTAGSGILVLQALLPALITAKGKTRLTIEGGTHNPYAPPYDFLKRVFLPQLEKMGCKVETEIESHGFYPAGGGKYTAKIQPAKRLKKIELFEKGKVVRKLVRGIVSQIPLSIAGDEVKIILKALSWNENLGLVEKVDSPGPGNAVMLEIQSENVTEMFTGFGEMRVPLKKIARNTLNQAKRYIAAGVPVGRFLADQLLIPMAMAGGGRFITLPPSMHTITNMEIIGKFLDVEIHSNEIEKEIWEIEIKQKI